MLYFMCVCVCVFKCTTDIRRTTTTRASIFCVRLDIYYTLLSFVFLFEVMWMDMVVAKEIPDLHFAWMECMTCSRCGCLGSTSFSNYSKMIFASALLRAWNSQERRKLPLQKQCRENIRFGFFFCAFMDSMRWKIGNSRNVAQMSPEIDDNLDDQSRIQIIIRIYRIARTHLAVEVWHETTMLPDNWIEILLPKFNRLRRTRFATKSQSSIIIVIACRIIINIIYWMVPREYSKYARACMSDVLRITCLALDLILYANSALALYWHYSTCQIR